MNFFQNLFNTGDVDITMRIMKKNDKLTINIMPGSNVSKIQPIILTGTPEELDADFFNKVMPEVNEIKGLISNIDAVKKEATDEAAKSSKPADKPKPKVKPEAPKAKKKAPEAKEASLFEADQPEEEQTDEDDNETGETE